MSYYVDKTAIIDENVQIGDGTKIWHFSHILRGSRIGLNCILGQNVMVGPDVNIGNNCKIQNNVSIYKGLTLEDNVFVGPSVVFTNVLNPRAFIEKKDKFTRQVIKFGATIGANSTIVGNIIVGSYSFIAAGSIVTKDTENFGLYKGGPAKLSGWVCICGEVLTREVYSDIEKKITCGSCIREYIQNKQEYKLIKE